MQGTIFGRRQLGLAAAALAAVCLGVLTGRSPLIGIGVAAALASLAVVAADLGVGIVVFTLASFTNDLPLSKVATAGKGVGFLLLIAWIASMSASSGHERRRLLGDQQPLVICALLFLCWSFLTAAWAQSPGTALSGSLRFAMDLALFPIVYAGMRDQRRIRWVVVTFVAGTLLSVAYGTAAGATTAGDPSRLAGALGDPNETAMVLVAAAVLAFTLLGTSRRTGRRLLWLACGLASLGALVDTGSRGGLVALVAAILTGIVLADRWRGRAVVAALVATAAGAVFFLAVAPSGASHITAGNGTDGRSTLWTLAVRAIESHPLQGLGTDNFAGDAKDFLLQPGATTGAGLVVETPKVAHNIYLEIAADLGVVGLLLFLGIVVACLRCHLRAIRTLKQSGQHADELIARGLLVATVGMLVADFFISDTYSKQLWLLLALGPAMVRTASAAPRPLPSPVRSHAA